MTSPVGLPPRPLSFGVHTSAFRGSAGCYVVAAPRAASRSPAGSLVAAGKPGHRRGKGGSGNRNKIKEKINCFICISGREAGARLGSGGRRVEVILGWALRVVQAPQRPQPEDGSLVACKISLSLAAAGLLRRDLCPSGGRLGSHRLEVL